MKVSDPHQLEDRWCHYAEMRDNWRGGKQVYRLAVSLTLREGDPGKTDKHDLASQLPADDISNKHLNRWLATKKQPSLQNHM